MTMKFFILNLIVFFLIFIPKDKAIADKYTKTGDALQLVLPISAFGMTYIKKDKEGRWQFIKSTGVTAIATHTIKFAAKKRRPDYSADNSFPSGHTSAAFSGASFYYTRYGPEWGIPAYALASYVGWSRVHADRHYWDDVLAGASIAILSNLYFVSPESTNTSISPMQYGDAIGINLTLYNEFFSNRNKGRVVFNSIRPKYRFSFIFGPSRLRSNIMDADIDNDFKTERTDFGNTDDSITTSLLNFEIFIDDRNTLDLSTNIFEIRDKGIVFEEGDTTTNNEIYSRYQVWDTQLGWSHNFIPTSKWISKVGVSLLAQYAKVQLYNQVEEQQQFYNESDFYLYPMINYVFGYKFNKKLDLTTDLSYGNNGKGYITENNLWLKYKFNDKWDASFGYSHYIRKQNNIKVFDKITFDSLYFRIGYSFGER